VQTNKAIIAYVVLHGDPALGSMCQKSGNLDAEFAFTRYVELSNPKLFQEAVSHAASIGAESKEAKVVDNDLTEDETSSDEDEKKPLKKRKPLSNPQRAAANLKKRNTKALQAEQFAAILHHLVQATRVEKGITERELEVKFKEICSAKGITKVPDFQRFCPALVRDPSVDLLPNAREVVTKSGSKLRLSAYRHKDAAPLAAAMAKAREETFVRKQVFASLAGKEFCSEREIQQNINLACEEYGIKGKFLVVDFRDVYVNHPYVEHCVFNGVPKYRVNICSSDPKITPLEALTSLMEL
jgi:hypothetical protein